MDTKAFSGFPTRTRFTPIPNVFFSTLLPQIDDPNELKVILHVLWLIYQKKGHPRFVTLAELLSDSTLMQSIKKEEALREALGAAVERGVLAHVAFQQDDAYFVNNEADKETVEQVRKGDISIAGMTVRTEPYIKEKRASVFDLYEQNIGLLTPMIAEALADLEQTYPAEWIKDAFKEAATNNKRSLRYVSRILERWATEGKSVGEAGRYSRKDQDPDKYVKGKYGHLVRR